MSAEPRTTRTIKTDVLARVEGEGAMHVRIRGETVEQIELRIFEPPRFFEAFLRGRRYTEPPDITARICGICPVAYQMSACAAIEAACGVAVDEPIRRSAASSTAANGSRATRCTSSCCTPRTSSATRACRWRASTAGWWSRD